MFLTVFFHWMYKMKYSYFQDSSVIHGWFVYWGFGWEMHRLASHWKIDFVWHRFPFSHCLMRERVEKSQSDSGLTWWLSWATSRLVSLSNYCICCLLLFRFFLVSWSRVVYATKLCTSVRFETMIWPSVRFDISLHNFKKSSDIFWPHIERKRSEEYLVITLAVKRKLWAIFLPRVHLEK